VKSYANFFNLFSAHLEAYRESLNHYKPQELYQPENYILSLGGKRLRPILCLIGCDLFDKDPKHALNSALSIEIFHNFSLIHDDILDAAPLRRNKETVHHKWNTNVAILSGDVMLVKSFKALEKYPEEEFKLLSSLLTRTAIKVCEGQQMDMNFENDNAVTVSDYTEMITNKTAVLLGCSLQMGAINGGADKFGQENLFEFGKHIGIAFQLLDDLLDLYSDNMEEFGKQPGGDILSNKKTYLLLKAFELANENQEAELRKFLLFTDNRPEEKIKGIRNLFDKLNIKKLSRDKADEHTQIALSCLNKLQVHPEKKERLAQFALELLNRKT
jgi:geranylgeranyl diphosphate synthase, type II